VTISFCSSYAHVVHRREQIAAVVSVLVVLTAYVFFGSVGTMSFHRLRWFDQHSDSPAADYYVRQAEGFLRGHLSLAATPDARLLTMRDPWDFNARQELNVEYLWDASYYRGRYYLYFTPLPVLLFYIPHRLIARGYPSDQFAATFFSAWAFVMAAWFVWRALANRKRFVPLWLWIAFIGIGNLIAFSLSDVRVYEVAVLCGVAMSATWAWALLRFLEKPTVRRAVWIGVWLALAIASRPNLAVLLLPTAMAMWRHRSVRVVIAAGAPLFVVACALAVFNYARFGRAFESGISYQMTFLRMRGVALCSLCSLQELTRFFDNALEYQFWTPMVWTKFPFVEALGARFDPDVSFPGQSEQVVGVAVIMPLVMIGTAFAALLALARMRDDPAAVAARSIFAGAWLILLSLSTCWWIVARYSLDFMTLMALATPVCIELGLGMLEGWRVATMPLRIGFVTLALYSILFGALMGFDGRTGAFRRINPKMYAKVGSILHVSGR